MIAEIFLGVFVTLGVSALGLLWCYERECAGRPIGRRHTVADNPSGEETRRDLAVSAAIVVACLVGTVAVAALTVWLLR